MFTAQEAINRLCDKREIFYDEMVDLMRQVMEGTVTPVQLAAILMGLHVKTESVSEIAAGERLLGEPAFSLNEGTAVLDYRDESGQFLHVVWDASVVIYL